MDEDHGDEDHGDEDHGDEDHGDEHGGHEGHGEERIFAVTTSDAYNLRGSFNLASNLVKSVDYFYRKSDYILTEGHEEMGHDEDHADEDHADEDHADEDHSDEDHSDEHHEDEHDGHGHGESTVFSSESDEFGATFDLSTDALAQKVAVNVLSEEVSIVGSEAFMNPSESDEVTLGYYASTEIGQFTVDFLSLIHISEPTRR